MSTIIQFKRGTSLKVNNYTSAKIGEPVFDYESGRLFISQGEGQDLIPVDQRVYLQGYEGYEEVSYGTASGVETASGEPSTDSDSPAGTTYIDSDTNVPYICVSNSDGGNAIWLNLNVTASTNGAPTVSDENYPIGAFWNDGSSGKIYIKTKEDSAGSFWEVLTDSNLDGVAGVYISASTNPTVNDDSYEVGTLWVNQNTDNYYICTDNSTGAAVWTPNTSGIVTDTSVPGVNDDSYDIGTIWVNTDTDIYYVCVDNSTGAAVWNSSVSSPSGVETSSSDPDVNDDSFDVGTIWVNTSSDNYFVCTDDSAGAAVWASTVSSPTGVHSTTSDPTINDDSDDGYAVGTVWINTSDDTMYTCVDATVGAAVWKQMGPADDVLPDQGGNSGKYLTTDGTNSSWANVDSLPSQGGNSGKYLTTDGSTASWAEVSGGSNFVDIRPDLMSLDDTDTEVSFSSAFSIFKTVNFTNSDDGAIWLGFELPSGFDASSNISVRVVYNLSGADNTKNIVLKTEYWAVGDGETPGAGAPTGTNSDTIGSTTSQGVKRKTGLTAISSGDIAANDTIGVKLTRDISGASDTYTGTFQLIAVEFYQ